MDRIKAIETLAQDWKISLEEALILFEGIMYKESGEYDKSISLYDNGLKLYPNSSKLLCAQGEVYLCKKEYELAINNFNCSLAINPLEEHAYFSRGEAYREKGNNDDRAINDYTNVLKLNPKYSAALIIEDVYITNKENTKKQLTITQTYYALIQARMQLLMHTIIEVMFTSKKVTMIRLLLILQNH
ncbi:hypothetical protein FACS1894172_05210 [Spirochaetia bacterium]|nr:hypothetical protein FACS1894164_05730 [Spirochaetia bacterium]GHU31016.1 hypothetical protein FACS1894172_05210 [Spirochaetia bacterium]